MSRRQYFHNLSPRFHAFLKFEWGRASCIRIQERVQLNFWDPSFLVFPGDSALSPEFRNFSDENKRILAAKEKYLIASSLKHNRGVN